MLQIIIVESYPLLSLTHNKHKGDISWHIGMFCSFKGLVAFLIPWPTTTFEIWIWESHISETVITLRILPAKNQKGKACSTAYTLRNEIEKYCSRHKSSFNLSLLRKKSSLGLRWVPILASLGAKNLSNWPTFENRNFIFRDTRLFYESLFNQSTLFPHTKYYIRINLDIDSSKQFPRLLLFISFHFLWPVKTRSCRSKTTSCTWTQMKTTNILHF